MEGLVRDNGGVSDWPDEIAVHKSLNSIHRTMLAALGRPVNTYFGSNLTELYLSDEIFNSQTVILAHLINIRARGLCPP